MRGCSYQNRIMEENDMGVYIELPKEWAKWSLEVTDVHDNSLEAKVTDLDLVRCGECIHRHEHEWYNTCDKHIGHGFEDDYFCKDGERNSKNNSNAI